MFFFILLEDCLLFMKFKNLYTSLKKVVLFVITKLLYFANLVGKLNTQIFYDEILIWKRQFYKKKFAVAETMCCKHK